MLVLKHLVTDKDKVFFHNPKSKESLVLTLEIPCRRWYLSVNISVCISQKCTKSNQLTINMKEYFILLIY